MGPKKQQCYSKMCFMEREMGPRSSRATVRCASLNFRELEPFPTSRGASLKVKGRAYRACVHRVLIFRNGPD